MKHPYYDSDKKKRRDEFSMKAIVWSFCLFVIIVLSCNFIPGCKEFSNDVGEKLKNDPRPIGPAYNYSHPNQWKDTK